MKHIYSLTLLIALLASTRVIFAQDTIQCSPHIADISALLVQAQGSFDSGDAQTGLETLAHAQSQINLEVTSCANYAAETAGDKRTNPIPFGQQKEFNLEHDGKASIQIAQYLDNADQYAKNFKPSDNERLIGIEISYTCESSLDATCTVGSNSNFAVVGSRGVVYDQKKTNTLPNNEGAKLFGGGQINYSMAFLVDKSETDFVFIVYPGFQIDPVYFSLQ